MPRAGIRTRAVSGDDVVVTLPALVADRLDLPPSHLDPYLDAAARCFARFGVRRTSVQDVADELGYNRATVYRQVGTVRNQLRLLCAREAHRFVASLPGRVSASPGPDLVVDIIAVLVEEARSQPVLTKLIADESELVGSMLARDLGQLRDWTLPLVVPLLQAAMDEGAIARRDPVIVGSWLLRTVVSLVVLEPEADLRAYLTEVLRPVLQPQDFAGAAVPN